MNKKILAAVLASLLAGTTHAATIYKNDNGDNIKVYGGAEVGGTFVSDTDKTPFKPDTTYVDDSFATIGLKGQTGNFFAKFEIDAERRIGRKTIIFALSSTNWWLAIILPKASPSNSAVLIPLMTKWMGSVT